LYILSEVIFAQKMKDLLAFVTTWMNPEPNILSEINQAKNMYIVPLICGI
jgi:hypothetical protein